ncbi:MFS transporter [Dactylosporangium sp. NBC_01737]|uniref:MFS transporter n=1 Tax=Dactylosporangium sp. NBC_01737 TaxID=2975959 RepID=UPI002E105668|nr:MFS transporter [Dactylosporangium sp. NBC_01737]
MPTRQPADAARATILPLALAQFICSYAGTAMNVAITPMAHDLHTTVFGIQATITLFTLTMAALMIPGSKLTDVWGRKRCLVAGLLLYGTGALLAAIAPGLGLMLLGNALLEGIGSALMIPPIYILVTVMSPDVATRAKYFGIVSGAGALGAATGPLIGGLITSLISWRASFLLQVLVIAWIIVLIRHLPTPPRPGPAPRFDVTGALLSAAGLLLVVLAVLQSTTYSWTTARTDFSIAGHVLIAEGGVSPVWPTLALGTLTLAAFILHLRRTERRGHEPLLHLRLFGNNVANLGLGTQAAQWLVMQGTFFVTAVYLQNARGYNAILTGLVLTPATAGILASSAAAERFARRRTQRTLIISGFAATVAGLALLLVLVAAGTGVWRTIPGLLLAGLGLGTMLTASVNLVQSAFPDRDQSDISGLSRAVSNLGSSLGTALAGSVIVSAAQPGRHPYAASLTVLTVVAVLGLTSAVLLPRIPTPNNGQARS